MILLRFGFLKSRFDSLETPGYLKQIQKIPEPVLKHFIFINLKIPELRKYNSFGKDGSRQMMKIHLKTFENLGYEINIY